METHNQYNSPSMELPNDENKLFDEADAVGNSTIPDLSLPGEVDEEEHTIHNVWEYAINDLFQLSTSHVEGKSLRSWVHSQQMESMEQFYEWEEHVIVVGTTQSSYKGNSWDNHTEFLKYISIKNLHMLWKYLHYLANEAEESSFNDDPYSFMGPEEFKLITRKQFMQWRLEHSSQHDTFFIQNTNCSLLLPDDGLNTERENQDNSIQQSNKSWKLLTGRASDNIPHHYPKF